MTVSALTGRSYLVTGAASGIGEAVAKLLGERGATVYGLDQREPSVALHRAIIADLADPVAVRAAIADLDAPLDGLVNVAGIAGTAPAEQVFKVNFLSLRELTRSASALMNPGGAVVNVSSGAAAGWQTRFDQLRTLMHAESFEAGLRWFSTRTTGDASPYQLSKEAITMFTFWSAPEFWRRGLRINAVAPSTVNTPILEEFAKYMSQEGMDAHKSTLGRNASPAEAAHPIVFLVSPEASWVNGQQLGIDGGLSATWVSDAPSVDGVDDNRFNERCG